MALPPVLATKLYAPSRRPRLVARPWLAERLDTAVAPGHRLTLVSAPAGYGKTTLIADWLAHLADRAAVHVAWLSLDEGDNDLARLLAHVSAALARAGLDAPPAGDPAALLNHVAAAGERAPDARWILVLDDYHVIEAAEVHDAVTFLLDHLPDQLRLVLATRSDPPVGLARLRSRGQLTELRAADLRFTPGEALEFLNRVMGLELTDADARALDARTEGWAAGLQLAALSLRGVAERGDIDDFIEDFAGSHRFVIDYLADEVLARLPAPRRDFLIRTAVLDSLSGPLCDAVTGGADGARTLAELDRGNLFVIPLDDRRAWYRYHHLFADVLRARLLAEQPDLLPELHRRAAGWYAAHGLAADAVRHALAAGDFDRAAYLMEEALPEVRRTRQDGLILTWLRALPEPVRRRSPVLTVISGWSLLMAGDLDAVGPRLDEAERALAAGARDPALAAAWADTEDLRTAPAMIALYRASLAQARGDVDGLVTHARAVRGRAGPGDHFLRGAADGFLGLAAWTTGDVRDALSTFGASVRSLHTAGNLVDALDGTIVLGDMWLAAGRPGRARDLYEQGLRAATGGGEPYPRATADLHVALAELDRELDDRAGAEAHLETARVLAERGSITENRHRRSVALAQVRAAGGDHAAAMELLDQAEAIYRRGFYPDLRPIPALRARLQIAHGDLPAAADWADRRGLGVADEPDYRYEYEHLTLARLRLAQHRAGVPVLGLLARLEATAATAGRDGSVLEIRTLLALAHHAEGDVPAALAVLGRLVADAPEPAAYVRLFLDEGPPMVALLRPALDVDALRPWARRLLDRAEPGPAPDNLLSGRELEVLLLLDGELTGPQIARRLFVSLNTLRTHTKRIFTKLDVTTRAAAVRRARERGLL